MNWSRFVGSGIRHNQRMLVRPPLEFSEIKRRIQFTVDCAEQRLNAVLFADEDAESESETLVQRWGSRVCREASVEIRRASEVDEQVTKPLMAVAIGLALFAVFLLLYLALNSTAEAAMILAAIPAAFVGSILALLVSGETWNVSWTAMPKSPINPTSEAGAGDADTRVARGRQTSPRGDP
jgi:hypothetical protein